MSTTDLKLQSIGGATQRPRPKDSRSGDPSLGSSRGATPSYPGGGSIEFEYFFPKARHRLLDDICPAQTLRRRSDPGGSARSLDEESRLTHARLVDFPSVGPRVRKRWITWHVSPVMAIRVLLRLQSQDLLVGPFEGDLAS